MGSETQYYRAPVERSATLLIIENINDIKVMELRGDMSLGRNTKDISNDIPMTSPFVGRQQGEFIYHEGSYYFRDNNSKNGTYINGHKIATEEDGTSKAVKLTNGDVIRIGSRSTSKAAVIVYGTTFSVTDKWKKVDLKNVTSVNIGRNAKTGISLRDFTVSRDHARLLKLQDGRWRIKDNGSKNGVLVNKSLVKDFRDLNVLDSMRIGNTTFVMLEDAVLFNEVAEVTETPVQRAHKGDTILAVDIEQVRVKKHGALGKKTLLKDIKLDIDRGEFILILGGSGAGKTTFINALLGINKPEGRIMFEGMDLRANYNALKHKIGIVPQFSTTRDNDTVLHTITDAAKSRLAGEYSGAEIKKRVSDVITMMGLKEHTGDLIKNLSGGQKKRVEVAIQAIGDQQVFILDEPDSGLDIASRDDLMRNLKSCTANGGVVAVISHYPDDAAQYLTKLLVLAKSPRDEVGHLAYYGDVAGALKFFEVSKLSDIVVQINYEGSGKGRADEFIDKFARTRSGR